MRRAISPIIAAVLLVIIAVAAGVMIWTWISGYAQQNPTEQPALRERIKIDAVNITLYVDADGTPDDVNVTAYVRNIGDVNTVIASMYLINATNGIAICQVNISVTPDRNVTVGSVTPIYGYCYNISDILRNEPVVVKVVTIRGTEATFQTIAPSR